MPPRRPNESDHSKLAKILNHNHEHEMQGLRAIFEQNDQIIELLLEQMGNSTPPEKIAAITERIKTVREALSKAIAVPIPVVS